MATIKPIAKDDFEQAGIDYIDDARTFADAKQRFDECCTSCRFRERYDNRGSCDGCPIRATLLSNIEEEWWSMRADDYLWYKLEQSSVDD